MRLTFVAFIIILTGGLIFPPNPQYFDIFISLKALVKLLKKKMIYKIYCSLRPIMAPIKKMAIRI